MRQGSFPQGCLGAWVEALGFSFLRVVRSSLSGPGLLLSSVIAFGC